VGNSRVKKNQIRISNPFNEFITIPLKCDLIPPSGDEEILLAVIITLETYPRDLERS
ncbi:hypothetical protein TNCV_2779861, partial [Trichonephila clavipes]